MGMMPLMVSTSIKPLWSEGFHQQRPVIDSLAFPYATIDGPESPGYPFTSPRSEQEAFLDQDETPDETPADDQFRHRITEEVEDAVQDFFEGEQSLRPSSD
jgi:hypothetical protein